MASDEPRWSALAREVLPEMEEWRRQHPTATCAEIEAALGERWGRVLVQLLQDVAPPGAAAEVPALEPPARPRCPVCGGREARTLTAAHGQPVTLTRDRAVCSACGTGLFRTA